MTNEELKLKKHDELKDVFLNSQYDSDEREKAKVMSEWIQRDTNNEQIARFIERTDTIAESNSRLAIGIAVVSILASIVLNAPSLQLQIKSVHIGLPNIIYAAIASVFIYWQGILYYQWHPMTITRKRHWREMLLNTLGSTIGWCAGYFLIFYRLGGSLATFEPRLSDFVIFLMAFYGMNGELPNVLINKLKLGAGN